jgi:hypothetical protein
MDKRITQTRRTKKNNGKMLGLIFALTGALVFYFFGLPPLKYGYKSKSWPKTEGTITQSEISSWMKDGNAQYDARINYSYTVDGKKYNSSKVNTGGSYSGSSMSKAKEIVAEYPTGKTVDVFYDPEVPDSAALQPGIPGTDIAVAAFSLLFFFIGLSVILGILKPQRTTTQNHTHGRTDIREVFKNITNR